MKATLSFTLPEEQTEFECAVNGSYAINALSDVRNFVFRPARKHGYSDNEIELLLEKLGDDGINLIDRLEQKFNSIVFDHGIEL